MLNYSILRFTREQRHIYYWNRVSYRENIVNKKRMDKEVQGSERGKLRWRKREGGGREEEEEKEARDRSWYRNSHAKSITTRRCSEIVPSSATYSGHWYVLSLSPFAPFPSLSLHPEGCLVSSLLLPCRPIAFREPPPSTSSSSSSFFSTFLVSIETSCQSHQRGEENRHVHIRGYRVHSYNQDCLQPYRKKPSQVRVTATGEHKMLAFIGLLQGPLFTVRFLLRDWIDLSLTSIAAYIIIR